MDTLVDNDEVAEGAGQIKTVSSTILEKFFDTLEQEESLVEIVPRLRKVVLEDRILAEPSVRAALFLDYS